MRIFARHTHAKADLEKGFIDGHIVSLAFETRYSRRIANLTWAPDTAYRGKWPWQFTLPEGGVGPIQWSFCHMHSAPLVPLDAYAS